MRSLRRNLVIGTAVATGAVFVALAVVLYASVRVSLLGEFDRGLLAQAEALAAAAEFHHGVASVEESEEPARFHGGSGAQYFEIWQGGRPSSRSHSLGTRDMVYSDPGARGHEFQAVLLPDGRSGRQVSLKFTPKNEEGDTAPALVNSATLVVARDTSHLATDLSRLSWLLAGACGTAVVLSAGLLTAIIRGALVPVNQIAARIDRVGRRDLSDRLDTAETPHELLPVANRLNEMLSRIETAFERERAFAADVAHELRTPLAGLETALEVAVSRPREPAQYQLVLGRCLQTTRQMHAMVESLLLLARAEAGRTGVLSSEFPLCDFLKESWLPFEARALERRLLVRRDCPAEFNVRADREKFRLVLHNLLDNAVSYVDEGGSVRIAVSRPLGALELTVANTGSALPSDMAQQVFERFWRGDNARTQNGGHCGLGLSIARELVKLMGGKIEVDSHIGREFVARVTLPMVVI
jgi:signal transduction histidine kinase